jgi:HAD superfamily hydrolase (TIGR01490 family)
MRSEAPIAFFDLDRTLIDANSGLLWARFERREGRISALQLARATFWMGMYHLSLIDLEKAYASALAHYRGVPRRDVEARTHAWFLTEVAPRLQPGARAAVDWHRSQGHRCVILTNSSPYQAAIAAQTWGLDGWISNGFNVDRQDRLDGTFEQPMSYGSGKIVRAERWVAQHGGSVRASWFYTDSLSDAPMLHAVERPRVVQPDPRLRRLASRLRWPILDWRTADRPIAAADDPG